LIFLRARNSYFFHLSFTGSKYKNKKIHNAFKTHYIKRLDWIVSMCVKIYIPTDADH